MERYNILGKERLKTLGKYYVVDTGLRNAVLEHRLNNRGHVLENVIYMELIKHGYEVAIGKLNEWGGSGRAGSIVCYISSNFT